MYGIYIIYHILYIYIVDIEHISGGSAAIAFSTRAETSGAAEDAEPAPPNATDELAPAPPSGLDFHCKLPPLIFIHASSAKSQRNKSSRFEHSAEERR